MKKMVFTLALLLMSLSAAMAQTWTFGAMSEADRLYVQLMLIGYWELIATAIP